MTDNTQQTYTLTEALLFLAFLLVDNNSNVEEDILGVLTKHYGFNDKTRSRNRLFGALIDSRVSTRIACDSLTKAVQAGIIV